MQNPVFLMQNSSFLIQNSSFLLTSLRPPWVPKGVDLPVANPSVGELPVSGGGPVIRENLSITGMYIQNRQASTRTSRCSGTTDGIVG